MRGRPSSILAGVGGLLWLAALLSPVIAASSATVNIGETNDRYHFAPTTTFVNVGGAVTWKNGSDAKHTVTSDSGNELGSSAIAAGKSYSHTFDATGTFAYHCTIHDYMVGKVVVLAAGATPPATDTVATVERSSDDPTAQLAIVLLAGLAAALVTVRRMRTTSAKT